MTTRIVARKAGEGRLAEISDQAQRPGPLSETVVFSDSTGKCVFEVPIFPDLIKEPGIRDTPTPIAKEPAMPASEARIRANKANSLKSSGPRTITGREPFSPE